MADPGARIHTVLLLREGGSPDRIVVWDTQDITLGRAPDNDLAVDHAEMSRNHARFVREGDAYKVQNLSKSNGTTVNGAPISSRTLENKDVVRAGELELHFVRTTRNPAGLGVAIQYASQLKAGALGSGEGNAGATMLGLVDSVDANAESFHVGPVGEFDPNEAGSFARTRDLDAELEDIRFDDLDSSTPLEDGWDLHAPAPQADASSAAAQQGSGRMSLHLELEGLTPDLRRVLGGLLGKVIDLPALRVRIKSEDSD